MTDSLQGTEAPKNGPQALYAFHLFIPALWGRLERIDTALRMFDSFR